jgi:hypothetical protein
MLSGTHGKQIVFFVLVAAVVGFFAVQMFYSLTPPRHADHDHAMASLDAGGFLRVQRFDGGQRNLVGRPGRVLILHFFDPAAASMEQARAAGYAGSIGSDPGVEVLFVARTGTRDGLGAWARNAGLDPKQLYLDEEGRTSHLLGVRRWPETLVYDPRGLLVYQSRGPADWMSPAFQAEVARAKAGVEEID